MVVQSCYPAGLARSRLATTQMTDLIVPCIYRHHVEFTFLPTLLPVAPNWAIYIILDVRKRTTKDIIRLCAAAKCIGDNERCVFNVLAVQFGR